MASRPPIHTPYLYPV